ncbi:glycosyltransferase [Ruegeria sp. 2012CJ41-6]|uniref:Glycosyltransferase n=1 Tax=Ruegeria spongiae TaxID=2942209 RepID=A0ABT0Q638_9RHOB|nr:glycosyltransferase [Ruegeria spongiae]MCL6284359.1 glycosyltransferase [Ruegeria spongiae]
MSDLKLNFQRRAAAVPSAAPHVPLGRILVRNGAITHAQLHAALELQLRLNAPIGEIIVAEGWASEDQVQAALVEQRGLAVVDLCRDRPEPTLWDLQPREFWQRTRSAPFKRTGAFLQVATARPDRFAEVEAGFSETGLIPLPVLGHAAAIDTVFADHFAGPLVHRAETRVAPEFSCRGYARTYGLWGGGALAGLAAIASIAPAALAVAAFAAACLTLLMFFSLRCVGFLAHILAPTADTDGDLIRAKLPKVSVIVPLYKEREIANALIRRLGRLTYPKALLDVILVLEAKDAVTRAALEDLVLPHWMRVLEVPDTGGLTTKPRALNYALDFCAGEIVGIWDAEDAPESDQIEKVVQQFDRAGPDVACLQGILDYYNPRTNWRARCFTIEYCSWFRAVMPGIARLGLVVPLGGTTLFMRKTVLEELGGWDAHNVTEDADLGVRLCRAGYRTEFIRTSTYEEANHRLWPWVKQRSRWLKGFMITYLVHMRAPRQLWRDLGVWRFLGVQAFFLGTLGQFLLAPVLWTFWLGALGAPGPWTGLIDTQVLTIAATLLLAVEGISFAIAATALSTPGRRFLLPWILAMPLYYPAGVIAAYKALYELAVKPYFWDKTQHGQVVEGVTP